MGKKAEPKTQMSHEELKAFADSLTAESFNTEVKCCGCEAACATAWGLANHLKKHGATTEDVQHLIDLRKQTDKARLEYYLIIGVTTRSHAIFTERVVRTFKEKLISKMDALSCIAGRS